MIPYFILMLIILILSLFRKKLGNKIYLIIIFSLLFLFLILKDYNYFPDHDKYLEVFNLVNSFGLLDIFKNYNVNWGYEFGYIFYNCIVLVFTNNYFIYLIITALISLIGYFYFIKNNSNNYFISILIFISLGFYSMNFYVLRSSIAVSIMLFSLKYLKERKILKYMLLILLASLFHKTMLIFIPLYFLLNIDYKKSIMIILGIFMSIVLIFKEYIINFFIKFIYNHYESIPIFTNNGGYKLLLMLLLIFIVVLYFKNDLIKKNSYNKIFINMLMFSLFFQVLATSFGPVNRITTYLTTSLIVLIPELLLIFKNRKISKWLNFFTIIGLIMIFAFRVIIHQQFYEYHLFFL